MNGENGNNFNMRAENPEFEAQRIYYDQPYNVNNGSVGWGVASLVLGIVALLSSCCIFSIIPGILGLIFGIVAIAKRSGKGMGIAGLIMSVVGIIISILFILVIMFGDVDGNIYDYGYYDDYEEYGDDDFYGEYNDRMEEYFEHILGDRYAEDA